ncbi:AFH_G0009480.mRNA.1.CDS.1 [Saccharomyces cerevisiae]|nr:Dos2p [Saccharomyces cerevisiae YJM1383]CAI4872620.1 AFH_G0009480.mRNA.1.CDS.1 [Saccharomyces cerevisiae]CAI5239572.1 CFF_HP2_G0008050.mRNA.1.CDS.1 [Saccharomyces cerevisiae]CAI6410057.1 CFF_HP2_G0008050.mRNA.1.CDS.1 [Saccharomyces cerevisiae]CAI6411410.1 CFF_HP1_G0008090.mRNA.1.CDS.1 [Saccharomyces cerevisiae]
MEFFYEEQVACIEDDKINDSHTKETGSTENTENNELQSRDDKTNEAFQKLEEEVNKRYEKTTSAFKKLVIEKDDGIEINLPISNETTETAQKYLKKLDENIHSVESLAQSYWSKMKTKNFWSGFSSFDNAAENDSNDKDESSKENEIAVGGNRTEAELRTLSKDKSVYLDNKMDLQLDPFDVDEKTEEICSILQGDKDISKSMNDIVPHKISYKDFWHIYFLQRNKILDKESKRKEILSKKEKETEEKEVEWDDEEEEDDDDKVEAVADNKSKGETKVAVSQEGLKDVSDHVGLANKDESKDDDDDDDDDDWE